MRIIGIFALVFFALNLNAQDTLVQHQGQISYVTSQHIYVKFANTEHIQTGDTLFLHVDGKKVPALVVQNKSSISCICYPVYTGNLSVNTEVWSQSVSTEKEIPLPDIPAKPIPTDTVFKSSGKKALEENKTVVHGRVSLASYSTFSDIRSPVQKMRYTVSTHLADAKDEKYSGDVYLTFSHSNTQWDQLKANIFNGLKVYNLSAVYKLNANHQVAVGRKINPKISNVGAIDGIQYQATIEHFVAGAFIGSRPDYTDYSFNAHLMQYGAYVSHDSKLLQRTTQTSLAYVDQYNNGNSDRRYLYFQHINTLVKNLYVMGSAEVDVFNKELNVSDSSLLVNHNPRLSNLYVSLRYRPVKKLTISASYSAIKNIIYYETYKAYVDQLLDEIFLQGFRGQINYHLLRNLTLGISANYRQSKTDSRASKNGQAFFMYNNLPLIAGSVMVNATLLETVYLNGAIFGINYNRDIIPGKLYGGISYKYFHYTYQQTELPLAQNLAGLNLSYRLPHKISCSLNYEGFYDNQQKLQSIYLNLSKRF